MEEGSRQGKTVEIQNKNEEFNALLFPPASALLMEPEGGVKVGQSSQRDNCEVK